VVDGAGFTFKRGSSTDLADRLRFLIANPAVREAAAKAAKRRIAEHYQWHDISTQIEKAYFSLLGREVSPATAKKPSGNAAVAGENGGVRRRAG